MNQNLYVHGAQGEFIPADRATILGAAQECLRNCVRRGASFERPASVREYFCVILLDLCVSNGYVQYSDGSGAKADSSKWEMYLGENSLR